MAPQVSDWPRRLLLIPSTLSTMILYLLCTALILRVVDSQTVNVTEEELSRVERNQTFTTDNSTTKPFNVTSSLYKDKKNQTEDQLQKNQTSAVITEDDEKFQDQEIYLPSKHCRPDLLINLSHTYCGEDFHADMQSISTEKWCDMKDIIRPYNDMTLCLETACALCGCYYPNPTIQDFFLYIHSLYFEKCTSEELEQMDAPHEVVVILTIIPVSMIPVLVYLVVWKSKYQD